MLLLPTGVVGGVVGGVLLLRTNERIFSELVPYLILLATALLAFQPQLRQLVVNRIQKSGATEEHPWFAVLPIFVAAIYGGYFGAGLGVILLATLGMVLDDTLTRLNALKQSISFCVNIAAAIFFLFSGQVLWSAAIVMAVAALVGGSLGGRLAGRIQPNILRWIVVSVGIIVATIYIIR